MLRRIRIIVRLIVKTKIVAKIFYLSGKAWQAIKYTFNSTKNKK